MSKGEVIERKSRQGRRILSLTFLTLFILIVCFASINLVTVFYHNKRIAEKLSQLDKGIWDRNTYTNKTLGWKLSHSGGFTVVSDNPGAYLALRFPFVEIFDSKEKNRRLIFVLESTQTNAFMNAWVEIPPHSYKIKQTTERLENERSKITEMVLNKQDFSLREKDKELYNVSGLRFDAVSFDIFRAGNLSYSHKLMISKKDDFLIWINIVSVDPLIKDELQNIFINSAFQ